MLADNSSDLISDDKPAPLPKASMRQTRQSSTHMSLRILLAFKTKNRKLCFFRNSGSASSVSKHWHLLIKYCGPG